MLNSLQSLRSEPSAKIKFQYNYKHVLVKLFNEKLKIHCLNYTFLHRPATDSSSFQFTVLHNGDDVSVLHCYIQHHLF